MFTALILLYHRAQFCLNFKGHKLQQLETSLLPTQIGIYLWGVERFSSKKRSQCVPEAQSEPLVSALCVFCTIHRHRNVHYKFV
jgi:hypothetical protein